MGSHATVADRLLRDALSGLQAQMWGVVGTSLPRIASQLGLLAPYGEKLFKVQIPAAAAAAAGTTAAGDTAASTGAQQAVQVCPCNTMLWYPAAVHAARGLWAVMGEADMLCTQWGVVRQAAGAACAAGSRSLQGPAEAASSLIHVLLYNTFVVWQCTDLRFSRYKREDFCGELARRLLAPVGVPDGAGGAGGAPTLQQLREGVAVMDSVARVKKRSELVRLLLQHLKQAAATAGQGLSGSSSRARGSGSGSSGSGSSSGSGGVRLMQLVVSPSCWFSQRLLRVCEGLCDELEAVLQGLALTPAVFKTDTHREGVSLRELSSSCPEFAAGWLPLADHVLGAKPGASSAAGQSQSGRAGSSSGDGCAGGRDVGRGSSGSSSSGQSGGSVTGPRVPAAPPLPPALHHLPRDLQFLWGRVELVAGLLDTETRQGARQRTRPHKSSSCSRIHRLMQLHWGWGFPCLKMQPKVLPTASATVLFCSWQDCRPTNREA